MNSKQRGPSYVVLVHLPIGLFPLPYFAELCCSIRLLNNGSSPVRRFRNQYNPLKDERGRVLRWYVTGTDIEDQKKTEERALS